MRIRLLVTVILLNYSICVFTQSPKIDSLSSLLAKERADSNKVTLLWRLAEQYQSFKPDTSLFLSEEALLLARQIGFTEGESRSVALLATSQYLLGNYPDALSNYMLKLKIEEKRKSPRNFASALNNIGLMYILLDEYDNALSYLYRADSTVEAVGGKAKEELKFSIIANIEETYYRMKNQDSAAIYVEKALELAKQSNDSYYLGSSMLSKANLLAQKKANQEALQYYRQSFDYLNDGQNVDFLCEVTLGMARVFKNSNSIDSALIMGRKSFNMAKMDNFLSRQLDAAEFLGQLFKKLSVFDSAFAYIELSVSLKDSIMGQEKTKQAMIISTNEKLRQAEMAELVRKEKANRFQQLQLLLIAIFIPLFFLMTLFFNRIKIHVTFIRFMGIISLLLLFEYLTLLLHPLIANFTNHKPIFELLIFVGIGAGLIPLHHKLEHVLISKLIKDKHLRDAHLGKRKPTDKK